MSEQIYEIINPSDQYTLATDNYEAACIACTILGRGQYGLNCLTDDRNKGCPIFLFGGSDAFFTKEFGRDLEASLEHVKSALPAIFDSVMIGGMADRRAYFKALELIETEEKRKEYRETWLDDRRSSMNNIGARAFALAEYFRKESEAA